MILTFELDNSSKLSNLQKIFECLHRLGRIHISLYPTHIILKSINCLQSSFVKVKLEKNFFSVFQTTNEFEQTNDLCVSSNSFILYFKPYGIYSRLSFNYNTTTPEFLNLTISSFDHSIEKIKRETVEPHESKIDVEMNTLCCPHSCTFRASNLLKYFEHIEKSDQFSLIFKSEQKVILKTYFSDKDSFKPIVTIELLENDEFSSLNYTEIYDEEITLNKTDFLLGLTLVNSFDNEMSDFKFYFSESGNPVYFKYEYKHHETDEDMVSLGMVSMSNDKEVDEIENIDEDSLF